MDKITEKSNTLQEILTVNPNEVNTENDLNEFEKDLVPGTKKDNKKEKEE